MKIAIYGAGAIGGYLGAHLALAGEDVTLIARGPHLVAMQQRGLRLPGPDARDARPDSCVDRRPVARARPSAPLTSQSARAEDDLHALGAGPHETR